MAQTKDSAPLRKTAGGTLIVLVPQHEHVQFVRDGAPPLNDDTAFDVKPDGTLDFHGLPVITQEASVKVVLPNLSGQTGWLRMRDVEKGEIPPQDVNPIELACECAFQEGIFGVSSHYLAAIAKLRSKFVHDVKGVEKGLYKLRDSEWSADWKRAEFGMSFPPSEPYHWRTHCEQFALMARRALDSYIASFGNPPNATDLYLTQLIGAPALRRLVDDANLTVDASLTEVGAAKMPPGSVSPQDQLDRYASVLKKAGGNDCKLADLKSQAKALLDPAIAETADLFTGMEVTHASTATAVPAAAGAGASLPGLMEFHRVFAGGSRWKLTLDGLLIEGEPIPVGSPGDVVTVKKIWDEFKNEVSAAAAEYGVPVELIIATIGAESSGNRDVPDRHEPGYVSDESTPGKVSVGLMQTLISTARGEAARLGVSESTITAIWLRNPRNSIRAGTSYIAYQRLQTGFDPPKVACAYNAGSIRENASANNRWRMRQYPLGTSAHADRFVIWFNDCFRHFKAIGITPEPSFKKLLGS